MNTLRKQSINYFQDSIWSMLKIIKVNISRMFKHQSKFYKKIQLSFWEIGIYFGKTFINLNMYSMKSWFRYIFQNLQWKNHKMEFNKRDFTLNWKGTALFKKLFPLTYHKWIYILTCHIIIYWILTTNQKNDQMAISYIQPESEKIT